MTSFAAEHISGLGLLVAGAAIICAAFIVLLRPWLRRYAMARPNARSSHTAPTPQGGGIAVISATMITATVGTSLFLVNDPADGWRIAAIFAATAALAAVGAVDDIRPIDVVPRLILQSVTVAVVIAVLPSGLRIIPAFPWWLERALLLIATLWFVNLVNFMDGIDWMTVVEVVPVTVALSILGYYGALPAQGAIVALALSGGIVGFAPFNRPVAKLFLGDVGSLPIGLLLGWLLISLAGHGHIVAALVLPLYYLCDATITLLRRIANREPFWQAHRDHFYQRATSRGFTVPEVVGRVFVVNVVLMLLAIASALLPGAIVAACTLVTGFAAVSWLLFVFERGKR